MLNFDYRLYCGRSRRIQSITYRLEAPKGYWTEANKSIYVSVYALMTYTNSKSLTFQVIYEEMNEMICHLFFLEDLVLIEEWYGSELTTWRTSISSPSPKFVSRAGLFPLNSRAWFFEDFPINW